MSDWFSVNNTIIRDSQEISNQFNFFITEAGSKLASQTPESQVPFTNFLGKPNSANCQFSFVSEVRILGFVRQLNPKWSCGEDSKSNNLIKIIIPYILQPLTYLITLSLQTGYVPPQTGKIIPIFKVTDCHNFNFYRPI